MAPDLIVGGLSVSNSGTYNTMLSNGNRSPLRRVAWSPDGKRFAYIQLNSPNPGVQVMVNGKPLGLTYNGAGDLTWSADGSTLAYTAQAANGLSFFVVNGQESQGYNNITEFKLAPPDGKRYAIMGYMAGSGFSLVLDGKDVPKARDFYKGSMGFSPDGKHFAYAATPNIQNYVAIVDGNTTPFWLGNWQTTRTYPPTSFPAFVWSADGNHVAYVGQKTDASIRQSVVVDGTPYVGPTQSYSFPAFSPDGKHFATLTWAGSGGRRIMIDGKLSDGYDDILDSSLAGVGWVDAHSYRFYGVKAGNVYRVRLEL
jgi:Tol biopolymer transport system component